MFRLIIFAITMLALSGICNGQGVSNFGATRAQDTSRTPAQLKLSAYGGSLDTMLLTIMPNGDVKKVAKNQFGATYLAGYGLGLTGNTFFVDTTLIESLSNKSTSTSLGSSNTLYPSQGAVKGYLDNFPLLRYRIYDITAYGATPSYIDSVDDDGLAIQAAIDAWEADFRQYGVNGVIFTPAGRFDIRTPLQKFSQDTLPVNAQIVIPPFYVPDSFNTPNPVLKFLGVSSGHFIETPNRGLPSGVQTTGSMWRSHATYDGSEYPAILGTVGYTRPASAYYNPLRSNIIQVDVENMHFQVAYDAATGGAQLCGVDLGWAGFTSFKSCRSDVNTNPYEGVRPTNNTFGFRGVRTNLGTYNYWENNVAEGQTYGFVVGEHAVVNGNQAFYNVVGHEYTAADKQITVLKQFTQNNRIGTGSGHVAPVGKSIVVMHMWDIEDGVSTGKWWSQQNNIEDTGSFLSGYTRYARGNNGCSGSEYCYNLSYSGGYNFPNVTNVNGGDLWNYPGGAHYPISGASANNIDTSRCISIGGGPNNAFAFYFMPSRVTASRSVIGIYSGQANGDGVEFGKRDRSGYAQYLKEDGNMYTAATAAYSSGSFLPMTRNITSGRLETVTGTQLNNFTGTTATGSLDFGSTSAQTSADLTISVTGAVVGDVVQLGVPSTSVSSNSCYTAWVSATNTVTVRFNNYSASSIDPASGTFRVTIIKY